jgi:mannose-1-phosphate guanylyltransferase/phosphomannomutase
MKAVVMAGGEGSRLRPITANRPKPLVPVANRPIMEHILGHLVKHGITDVIATVHYLAGEIQGYFGDGSDMGCRIQYSLEETPLGTAGSVKKAEPLFGDSKETFLIISGDALTDCDLTKAIEFHKAQGSMATLILYRVPNPLEFGVVVTDESGSITRFLEKPGWAEVFSDTVNTGMYILEPEVFEMMEPGKVYDWSRDIFPKLLAEKKPMFGYVMEGYWADIGSLTQYREAQEHFLSGRADLVLPGTAISMGVHAERDCQIDSSATLVPPVLLGRNVKVREGARIGPYTVIGDNCVIEEDATVERSVVWDSTYIGPNVQVCSAIVGARATIKKDSVVAEDAVIGDRCLLDVGCTIRPRVKLWPDKIIERGSTVTMSLVWGNRWRGALFRELGVAGLSNIEITPDFAVRIGAAFGSTLSQGSRVVTSRDSTRSSRMAKRAIIAALLSVGCNVLDLRGIASPIARHFIKHSGAAGAVNVRKLPGNARVTLIEMLDGQGMYLPLSMERKIENAFFREDFNRTDPDDLGMHEGVLYAVEEYQKDFGNRLHASGRRLRIAVDYGYTALGQIFPAMLARLGVESLSLNTFNDAKLAPRSTEEVTRHAENLQNIVTSLGYDLGALLTNEGERLTIVDDRGEILDGNRLFAAFALLAARSDNPIIAMPPTAPVSTEALLRETGATVVRTKAGVRNLIATAVESEAALAGDHLGGFVFPDFHCGFDAAYGLGRLATLLQCHDVALSEVVHELPEFHLGYEQVRVPWEAKGSVMRKLGEERPAGSAVDVSDGVRVSTGSEWALVLPDSFEPVIHIYAETTSDKAEEMAREYARKVEALASG